MASLERREGKVLELILPTLIKFDGNNDVCFLCNELRYDSKKGGENSLQTHEFHLKHLFLSLSNIVNLIYIEYQEMKLN